MKRQNTTAQAEEMARRYLAGELHKDIGLAMGFKREQVGRILRRLGVPSRTRGLTPEQRFWQNVDTSAGPDECWPWTATLTKGYGHLSVDGKLEYAHRFAWSLKNGPIEDGLQIRHSCDNPPCCNEAHLLPGTQQDNSDDMVRRGRSPDRAGEAHPQASMTDERAREILAAYRACQVDGRMPRGKRIPFAEEWAISPSALDGLVGRKSWRHLEAPC